MGWIGLIVSDFVLSFMFVWSGALTEVLLHSILGLGFHPSAEIFKGCIAILFLFFFAWLKIVTRGGSYNPLTVLSFAISGNFADFLLTVFGRIPAQVIGSVIGVRLIINTFPEVSCGPILNVDVHRGALVEGLLTFMIVIVSLGLNSKDSKGFFAITWISSICKGILHILGSDSTGGCMNPSYAFGWAYARGGHITKEHLFVYWLAPVEGALLGVWMFSLFVQPKKREQQWEENKKIKSE